MIILEQTMEMTVFKNFRSRSGEGMVENLIDHQ